MLSIKGNRFFMLLQFNIKLNSFEMKIRFRQLNCIQNSVWIIKKLY